MDPDGWVWHGKYATSFKTYIKQWTHDVTATLNQRQTLIQRRNNVVYPLGHHTLQPVLAHHTNSAPLCKA